ncbi:MAG: hypothetical protein V8T10_07195 [Merdibacter sp.]
MQPGRQADIGRIHVHGCDQRSDLGESASGGYASEPEDVYVDIIASGERSALFNDNWDFIAAIWITPLHRH